MKRVVASIFAFVISVPTLAFSQSVELPDYKKWEEISAMKLSVEIDGRDVNLGAEFYRTTDDVVLKRQTVSVIYDEQNRPWLAQYYEEFGERMQDGTVSVIESNVSLFENKNGKWVEVWRDANGFLRQNYKLRVK